MKLFPNFRHPSTSNNLFIFSNKNCVFRPRLEHSYFSADLRLKYNSYDYREKYFRLTMYTTTLLGVYTCILHCDRKVTSVNAVLLFNWVVWSFRKRIFHLNGFHRILQTFSMQKFLKKVQASGIYLVNKPLSPAGISEDNAQG